jgi:hypothetical protein
MASIALGRAPNPGELHYLWEALKKLEAGLYPEGEDAMLKAERINAISDADAAAIGTNDGVGVAQLRVELSRILQNAVPWLRSRRPRRKHPALVKQRKAIRDAPMFDQTPILKATDIKHENADFLARL